MSHYDTYVYFDTAQLIAVMMTNKINFVTFVALRSIPNWCYATRCKMRAQ